MAESKRRKFLRYRRILLGLTLALLALALVFAIRRGLRPIPRTNDIQRRHASRVQIRRDEWGVAHIHGQSDADAAFGLAYAQCEDNFETLQDILAATRGQLSLLHLSKTALINDYYTRLMRVELESQLNYEQQLSKETRAVLEGYAAGVNYYAALHPGEADGRLFPINGIDLAAGFVHKIPLFMGVNRALEAIRERSNLAAGDLIEWPLTDLQVQSPQTGLAAYNMAASNAHAVGRRRSADGMVRLNINSHQPWTGPVAWYEAHISSEEGWNMIGGTFPGGPFIFHGHNDFLGWAHTVNAPDLWDVYQLKTDDAHPGQYSIDGQWKSFDVLRSTIQIDIGIAAIPYASDYLYSEFGPVLRGKQGYFAIRFAGQGRLMRAAEQWYRMNRARNFGEWQKAMEIQGLPMFHTIYADSQNIFYVYNALLPRRKAGVNYHGVLPGDRSDYFWKDYMSFAELPQILNPPADFLQNANSTPWRTTLDPGNPDPRRFPVEAGIETRMTNRALRALQLFGGDAQITRADFIRYKWDRSYAPDAPIMREAILPLLAEYKPENEDEARALELLRRWDRSTDEDSRAAALAILVWRERWKSTEVDRKPGDQLPALDVAFQKAVQFLMQRFDRVDPKLGEVQRLHRGRLDLPLGGGPDVLNAIHCELRDGRLVGFAGDSYINIVEFGPHGPHSWSLHQFGQSERVSSEHYADQAPLFAHRQLRDSLFDPADLAERTRSVYHPGEEPAAN
ncbi:MAG: penicillin acylase family protein [Leptospirales bacterium]|nr:penicillin acylase family protein [Leptospirales bacterium]